MLKSNVIPLFEKKYYTVSELTNNIKSILENEFFDVYVIGEVSNLANPTSGHSYFTLKDKQSTVKCVIFRSQKILINYAIKNGDEILVRGRVSLYAPRGEYQIIVDYLEPYGTGKLFLKIEELKLKLEAEGLFDQKHKTPIPDYPEKIAVITSKTGAAIKDILNVLQRRFNGIEIFIYPVQVQGENSAKQIANAVKFINKEMPYCDIIIIARGGGSIEDLMPFNDENVARAIFDSDIPVISAIGHETDFTISDFVADLRAPTPSAAAELMVNKKTDLILHIDTLRKRLISTTKNSLVSYNAKLSNVGKKLSDYYNKLVILRQKLHSLENFLINNVVALFRNSREKNKILKIRLKNNTISNRINSYKQSINNFLWKADTTIKNRISIKRKNLSYIIQLLNNLSPLNILSRGYSITFKNNEIVKKAEQLEINDKIDIKLSQGSIVAEIISKKER